MHITPCFRDRLTAAAWKQIRYIGPSVSGGSYVLTHSINNSTQYKKTEGRKMSFSKEMSLSLGLERVSNVSIYHSVTSVKTFSSRVGSGEQKTLRRDLLDVARRGIRRITTMWSFERVTLLADIIVFDERSSKRQTERVDWCVSARQKYLELQICIRVDRFACFMR